MNLKMDADPGSGTFVLDSSQKLKNKINGLIICSDPLPQAFHYLIETETGR